MILYLCIIFICMGIIMLFNGLFNIDAFGGSVWIIVLAVSTAVIIEIIIDLIVAFIVHSIKDKYFKEDSKFYTISKKERQFYEKIGIKKWKDKILELGSIGGFSKSKLENANDIGYINKFLMESYKGIIVHIANIIFGFVLMLIPPFKWSLCVSLPVAIVNTCLAIPPIMVLRYNIPKLQIVRKRIERTSNN